MRPFQPFELKIIANGLEHALEHRATSIKQILPGFAVFNACLLLSVIVFPVPCFSEESDSSLTKRRSHLVINYLFTFIIPDLSFLFRLAWPQNFFYILSLVTFSLV